MPKFNVTVFVAVPVKIEGIEATDARDALDKADDSRELRNAQQAFEEIENVGDVDGENSHYHVEESDDEDSGQFYHDGQEPLLEKILRPLVEWYDAQDHVYSQDDEKFEQIVSAARAELAKVYG